jgi:hypothetical protein
MWIHLVRGSWGIQGGVRDFLLSSLTPPTIYEIIDHRRIMALTRKSNNEKVADKMTLLVNDVTLDLDQVGSYIARTASNVTYRRLLEIVDAARFEKEEKENGTDYLF